MNHNNHSCLRRLTVTAWLLFMLLSASTAEHALAESTKKKIVLIAGPKSHGPVGNRIHDYPWSVKLLKVMLDNSNVKDRVEVEYHLNGWPENPTTFDDADTIMVISDGRDGDKFQEAPHFRNQQQAARIQEQIDRGCGFVTFHFSTFAPDSRHQQSLQWTGGYFDWETDGQRKWYSAIKTEDAEVQLASKSHPVSRGVKPFKMREEFYYNLRFAQDGSVTPIWVTPTLPGREPDGKIVAWAKQRADGGRGFGTTCGHFYDNWRRASFRTLMLNALIWTAGLDPPAEGVQAEFYSHEQIDLALDAKQPNTAAAVADKLPIRALMFAGNAAHKWHNWEKTTPALKQLLERDPRIQVEVSHDIEDLGRKDLSKYSLVIQNYANWHDPTPLSDRSKQAFMRFLNDGGGLLVIHFANGAFHFSLPEAAESDWPEYRKIVRRVWNHNGEQEDKSGHDAFGKFEVRITNAPSPITEGLSAFEVQDELYFRQAGDAPITPLIAATSKVTKKTEPLAWSYRYGKGRVFQTLLGHSEKTYNAFEPREMLRRAAAWAADRTVLKMSVDRDPVPKLEGAKKADSALITPRKKAGPVVAPGKFGGALNAAASAAMVSPQKAFHTPPLTVEFWTKLRTQKNYNILVAHETKASPKHWEIFTVAGSGQLAVYMPGMTPDHVHTGRNICDDRWRHCAMVWEPQRLRIFLDGKPVADQAIRFGGGKSKLQALAIGALVSKTFGCDGLIDDLRIRRGSWPPAAAPNGPLQPDAQTVGLWSFDELVDAKPRRFPGAAKHAGDAQLALQTRAPPTRPAAPDHWGRTQVGFDWTESDSADGRWNQTDVGRFLACTTSVGKATVLKGLAIRVGDQTKQANLLYDTSNMQFMAGWIDGFLRFDPARYGLIRHPAIDGQLQLASQADSGWPGHNVSYRGAYRNDQNLTLSYSVDDVDILELPAWNPLNKAFRRTVQIGPSETPLQLLAFRSKLLKTLDRKSSLGFLGRDAEDRGMLITLAHGSHPQVRFHVDDQGRAIATIAPHKREIRFTLRYQPLALPINPSVLSDQVRAATEAESAPIKQLTNPGSAQWTQRIVTRGELSKLDEAYVVDTVTLPFNNPYRALMFVGGHDFFSNGDAAICTVHGDVWLARGVDADLEEIVWKRYATGLFQPLGLRIVKDRVYVLGRDQITRLHDANGDDEADFYECFNNDIATSPGTHDYVACLETGKNGDFFFMHAKQGLQRLSRDGTRLRTVATGFRNPNGMGVGPGDVLTASPQEGEWTPASNIAEVMRDGYYGFGGPRITATRPNGFDPPMCWIPRRLDNSSGGQVWAIDDRWGPLSGSLIHLSFGQCSGLLVLREVLSSNAHVSGNSNRLANRPALPTPSQGGVAPLPWKFKSGVMRGRMNPADGQLYVSGMTGWVTSAIDDGCLQRVRYTGKPLLAARRVQTLKNGLALTFTQPLDKTYVEDPDRYHVEQWNYRWSASYGSDEYLVSDSRRQGRDTIEVRSATLLDRYTLFLELPELQPVMQLGIQFSVQAEAKESAAGESIPGRVLRSSYYHTIHHLSDREIPAERLARVPRPGTLAPEQRSRIRSGLLLQLTSTTAAASKDYRKTRLAAIYNSRESSPSNFLPPGEFQSKLSGFLRATLRGTYRFQLEGRGKAIVTINGQRVLAAEGDMAKAGPVEVNLHKGYNALNIDYLSQPDGEARLRLLWSGQTFEMEPISPQFLAHDSGHPALQSAVRLHAGRELFAELRCARCHQSPHGVPDALPDLAWDAPNLSGIGNRVRENWLARWLAAPKALRNKVRMPHMFRGTDSEIERDARDVAAFLLTLKDDRKADAAPSKSETGKPKAGDPADEIARGLTLFESLACAACHRFTPPNEADEFDRVSLRFAAAKFQPGALDDFLAQPNRHYAATRMPDFQLTEFERRALTAFIRERSLGRLAALSHDGDVARGKLVFERSRCAACHATSFVHADRKRSVDLNHVFGRDALVCATDVASGEERTHKHLANTNSAPRFVLPDQQLAALRAFLQSDGASLGRSNVAEQARRWIKQLRCQACHDRDVERGDRGVVLIEEGELGLPPEMYPTLTWAGEKLQTNWVEKLLSGKIDYRPREWLRGRMPAFPQYAEGLSQGLASQHGEPSGQSPFVVDAKLSVVGNQLTGSLNGLNCRQCHAVGSQKPQGDARTKIAPGINFAHTRDRLRLTYYRRYLLDPPRYEVGSKMPRLAPDRRNTALKSVYSGDARKQFESIWHFIQSIPDSESR